MDALSRLQTHGPILHYGLSSDAYQQIPKIMRKIAVFEGKNRAECPWWPVIKSQPSSSESVGLVAAGRTGDPTCLEEPFSMLQLLSPRVLEP